MGKDGPLRIGGSDLSLRGRRTRLGSILCMVAKREAALLRMLVSVAVGNLKLTLLTCNSVEFVAFKVRCFLAN